MSDRRYWLFKCNPAKATYDDLLAKPNQTAPWHGVRNYRARNFMLDDMKVGDGILFYHCSIPNPQVVGIATVTSPPYPDKTAHDPRSDRYDPKSGPLDPKWFVVDIKADGKLPRSVTLAEIKGNPKLAAMRLLKPPNQLSIQPVTREEYDEIIRMSRTP